MQIVLMEEFKEGQPLYFAPVSAKHYEKYPGVVHGYLPCSPSQKCPILIEEQMMHVSEYQTLAARTECDQAAASRRRLYHDQEGDNKLLATRLSHAVLGLTGEVGELATAIEHWLHYGQPLDVVNIQEEAGDCMWYLALACNALGISMQDVMEKNIAKLKQRFPDKYSDQLAAEEGRNRQAERQVLEDNYPGHYGEEFRQHKEEQARPLTDSYDRYCKKGCGQPVHKSNELQICPDCAAAMRAVGIL